jgi:serine phosphatase RsbU (regulator of sigma subunit)
LSCTFPRRTLINRHYFVFILLVLALISRAQNPAVLDSLQRSLAAAPHDSIRVKLMRDIFWQYIYSEPQKAKEISNQLLKIAQNNHNDHWLASAYKQLGIYHDVTADYEKAIEYYSSAAVINIRTGDKVGEGYAYNNIGLSLANKGDCPKALSYYFRALRLFENSSKDDARALALANIGEVFYKLKNFRQAINYLDQSYTIYKKLNAERGLARCYTLMAHVHEENNEYDNALEYHREVLKIGEKLGYKVHMAHAKMDIARVYQQMGRNKEGLAYVQKAITELEAIEDVEGIIVANILAGGLYNELNEREKAIAFLQKALGLSIKHGAKTQQQEAMQLLSEIYTEKGDHKRALELYRQYTQLKDSAYTTENIKQIAEMQTRYESEKKQQQIEILTRDKENERLWRNASLGGIVLAGGFAFLLYNRYKIRKKASIKLEQAYMSLELKNAEIAQKNREMVDSINYAKHIQTAILPAPKAVTALFSSSAVLYMPKDIVSGDFYWIASRGEKKFIAAADCTGHGVPGALMSMIGTTLLNEIVNEKDITAPGEVLYHLREGIIRSLKQTAQGESKDGMDIAFCVLSGNVLEYAGANNPLWIVRRGAQAVEEKKADKQPIGIYRGIPAPFTTHSILLSEGDSFYIFTDGYADQFGGPQGKKFKYKQLQRLILEHSWKPMHEQEEVLRRTIEDWRGNLEQVDDILVIGIRL